MIHRSPFTSELELFLGSARAKREVVWGFLCAVGRGVLFLVAALLLVVSSAACAGEYAALWLLFAFAASLALGSWLESGR
jgi:hypothetical protein